MQIEIFGKRKKGEKNTCHFRRVFFASKRNVCVVFTQSKNPQEKILDFWFFSFWFLGNKYFDLNVPLWYSFIQGESRK